ncbi:MAG: hypothetical protein P8X93_02945, partial [Gammaproteobacteria bacterium]
HIFGVMIESHLVEGRQDVEEGKDLTYGQSITDACLGWDDTEKLISQLAEASCKRIKSSRVNYHDSLSISPGFVLK